MELRKATERTDRISNLPEAIRQHILSLLPTSDAIRAGAFSSAWRYDWISLPFLDFGEEFWNSQKKKLADNWDFNPSEKKVAGFNFSLKKKRAFRDIDIDDKTNGEYSKKSKLIDADSLKIETLGYADHSEKSKVINTADDISNIEAFGYVQFLDNVLLILRTHDRYETRKLRLYLPSDLGVGSTSVSMDLAFTTGGELEGLSHYIEEYRLRARGRCYLFNLPKYLLASSKSLTNLELEGNLGCNEFRTMFNERKKMVFPSLRKLFILSSRLDQRVVDNLLASCSANLEELIFCKCKGLKLLQLSGFSRLRVLIVGVRQLKRVEINVPNLHTLRLVDLSRSLSMMHSVKVASCSNLEKLCLHWCNITNDYFDQGLANFARLKSLYLWSCRKLTHIKVQSNSLGHLAIHNCRNLLQLEIDTPNLVSFSYVMCEKSKIMSLYSRTPIAPQLAWFHISLGHATNHTQWHSKVVELLANFSHSQDLHFTWEAQEKMIIPQDLRESSSPPLWGVQRLGLRLSLPAVLVTAHDIIQYLDTALWLSPHPKTISLVATESDEALSKRKGRHEHRRSWSIYLDLQYKEGMGEVENTCCCYPCQPINCWRHSLKDFKIKEHSGLEDTDILSKFFDNALFERRK